MDIKALGYLGFESPEAKAWEKFGPEIFGLGLTEPGNDETVYLRMDDRHHRIAIHPGKADRLAYIGWELRGSAVFAAAVEELHSKKLDVTLGSPAECAERQVQGLARIHDPAGYVHEVFYGPTLIANSFLPGKPMGGFVADGNGVGHVVVVVPELTRELDDFATGVLGFELFSGAPADLGQHGGPKPQFYRCNRRTHCFAYVGIPGMRGVQHICIEANRLDDVGRAYDLVQERNLPMTLSLDGTRRGVDDPPRLAALSSLTKAKAVGSSAASRATSLRLDVATYIEALQQEHSAPGVKQQLAAVRMLFDWLITGQVLPTNPAAAVRGPKHAPGVRLTHGLVG
jgi:extradiol dioxygenase